MLATPAGIGGAGTSLHAFGFRMEVVRDVSALLSVPGRSITYEWHILHVLRVKLLHVLPICVSNLPLFAVLLGEVHDRL